jgi:hypothetical protein
LFSLLCQDDIFTLAARAFAAPISVKLVVFFLRVRRLKRTLANIIEDDSQRIRLDSLPVHEETKDGRTALFCPVPSL